MSGFTRWWENYLVRYLMPSIAGMFFIAWLYVSSPSLHVPSVQAFVGAAAVNFSSAHLLLWVLMGSLYCYVASYPILVFHATRVLDFKDRHGHGSKLVWNPYLITFLFFLSSLLLSLVSETVWSGAKFFLVLFLLMYSGFQFARIYFAIAQGAYGFMTGFESSFMYAYLNKLSKRRSVKSTETNATPQPTGTLSQEDSETSVTKKEIENFESDLSDSYRHLREHGNTAFIFVLEIALLPIAYVVLNGDWCGVPSSTVSALLLCLWCAPAVMVHWMGQHLERRFSNFDHTAP